MEQLDAVVITASNRAAAGVYGDRSGPVVAAALAELGFLVSRVVVGDGAPVGAALSQAVAQGVAVVVTTGGTGLSPQDLTPEVTEPLLDRHLPHLAAQIAMEGVRNGVASSVLSRGVAGVAGSTLVVNLPGSPGGARDGMRVLGPLLRHAVEQVRGVDHPRGA